MKTFKAIGFDFTGVLFGEPASIFSQGAADSLHISVEDFHKAYFRRNHELNVDKLPFEIFWPHVAEEAGKPEHGQALLDFALNVPPKHLNMDIVRIAQDLKHQGFKIGILSNNTPEGAKEIRTQDTIALFDTILVSSDIGLMKPDPKVFRLFAERLDIDPTEMIFIDDSSKSLSTAEEVGYHPILFTDTASLLREFKTLGIHVD